MNTFRLVEDKVTTALEALKSAGELPADLDLSGVEVQEPRDSKHGDCAVNAAMVLAKRAGRKPRDIAEALKSELADDADLTKIEVAGPGFLNISFAEEVWARLLSSVLEAGGQFGQSQIGAGKRVHIEYVSANPTGPMHVGHCRGAVFGDALGSLLAAAGYAVTREYYVNDAGAQVDKLGQSAFLRYREVLGEDIGEIPAGLYPGDYLKPVGQALADTYGHDLLNFRSEDQIATARDVAIEMQLEDIKADLESLGVAHDVFFSERSLTAGDDGDQVAEAIALLREKGLIYEGRLSRPKGHDDDDWEDREQTLFRSTEFGDDVDRALMKSDGTYTYFAGDVAYHNNKLKRKFDLYFNVLGADHVGYIPRLKAVVRALSDGQADFDTPVCQLVKVVRDGQPVQMSKRAGTFVALRDVVDEVGRDPVRFMMLMNKSDTQIDFDLAKVVEQSKDNPVFYVQYAHARVSSVLRNAATVFPDLKVTTDQVSQSEIGELTDDGERELLRQIARYPKLIETSAREREPHRLTRYLYDLASALHTQWARGNDSPHLRFIDQDRPGVTKSRLLLVRATQLVVLSGLTILGVNAPNEMR
ncbi:MAG: arginine--tRNA ligase [Pseudomonadota bacterium]